LAAFKKWRHDLELFLETIGTSWKGVTAVMRTSRIFTENFTGENLKEVEELRKKTEPSAPDLDPSFSFHEKADALYKLLMPKLPVGLSTELRQVGTPNGFELFRLLTQKLDPPRADCAFHLANELSSCAPPLPCEDFAQTVRFVKFFDQKQLDYTPETGEKFPDDDAARVLSQAIDEDTMGRVDDNDDISIETYLPVKTWILQREVKLKLRKNTRSGKGKNPDDMVYGVSAQPPSEAPSGELQPLKAQTLGFQALLTLGLHSRAYLMHRQPLQRHLGQMCPQHGRP